MKGINDCLFDFPMCNNILCIFLNNNCLLLFQDIKKHVKEGSYFPLCWLLLPVRRILLLPSLLLFSGVWGGRAVKSTELKFWCFWSAERGWVINLPGAVSSITGFLNPIESTVWKRNYMEITGVSCQMKKMFYSSLIPVMILILKWADERFLIPHVAIVHFKIGQLSD